MTREWSAAGMSMLLSVTQVQGDKEKQEGGKGNGWWLAGTKPTVDVYPLGAVQRSGSGLSSQLTMVGWP